MSFHFDVVEEGVRPREQNQVNRTASHNPPLLQPQVLRYADEGPIESLAAGPQFSWCLNGSSHPEARRNCHRGHLR